MQRSVQLFFSHNLKGRNEDIWEYQNKTLFRSIIILSCHTNLSLQDLSKMIYKFSGLYVANT